MSESTFKPKAYLLNSCPFCFKYLLFMGEARLVDQIDVIGLDPQAPEFEQTKAKLAQSTQTKVSFPIVEVEPGVFKTDSDQLIDYFAKKNNVNADGLPVLAFYKQGLFPAYINLYKENMTLKQKANG